MYPVFKIVIHSLFVTVFICMHEVNVMRSRKLVDLRLEEAALSVRTQWC